MKKFIYIIGLALILGGCTLTDSSALKDKVNSKASSVSVNEQNMGQNYIGFIRPDTRADINGTIKSITGNEVIVTQKDLSEVFGASADSNMNRTRSQNMSDEERQKLRDLMLKAPTVETKVLIPVGINMGKRIVNRPPTGGTNSSGNLTAGLGVGFGGGRGGAPGNRNNNANESLSDNEKGGAVIQEASLSDLKIGQNINIWLDQKMVDRKIAESAMITEFKNNLVNSN